ncbi:MAG: hypothetical protein IJ711_00800 [Lachnospiraceae bacterium]|nr:hypothetical protein [Lachnospiraceae bacterium]
MNYSKPLISIDELKIYDSTIKKYITDLTLEQITSLVNQLSVNEILSSTQPNNQNNGDTWLKIVE